MQLPTDTPMIQIAGFHSADEVLMCLGAGATHIGFPLALDVHKEDISAQEVGKIVRDHNLQAQSVLITYAESFDAISELLIVTQCEVLQAHGNQPPSVLLSLREHFPNLTLMKSIVIGSERAWQDTVSQYDRIVHAFITDTFDPNTGASGATGKTHDWNISRAIVEASSLPVIIAGGLNPSNVAAAVRKTQPFGVDAHTGVEDPDGQKSFSRVRDFCTAAKTAFQQLLQHT